MIDLSNIKNYYIACGYTDLRRGIDGLAQIVMLQYGCEIDENSLSLFLRAKNRPDQSAVVFGRWICPFVQALE